MGTRRQFMSAVLWCIAFPAASQVTTLPGPQGTVILTVGGAIVRQNAGQTALFDLAMLDALPQVTFSTTTIWTEGATTYSGPALLSVLVWLQAEPGSVRASAANDYNVTLASGTIGPDFPILATRKNGLPFGARESGPIWLIYPYDSPADYRNDLIYSQSVWQLTHITVSP